MNLDVLYHHSPQRNRSSILEKGLSREYDETGMNAIFLTEYSHGGEKSDTYCVDVSGLELEMDWTTDEDGAWMYFGDIPPERIERKTK